MERGWKPTVEICPPCPRCGSSNTKFCYYNNYSLTQPRYFCKGCRRYWTKGGSLRNIPVGGGCRKTRRTKSVRVPNTANTSNVLIHRAGEPTGYTAGGSTTTIDLQQVYTNFLNQRPQSVHDQVVHGEVDPMTSFSGIPNMEMEFGVANYGASLESFLEGNGRQLCGYNSIFSDHGGSDMSNCGLPPLPGEELGWSESNVLFPENVLNARIDRTEGGVSGECSGKMFGLTPENDEVFRP